MPAGNLDAMVYGGLAVRGKMDMATVFLYFISQGVQQDIEVFNGFHPDIMGLEP